MMENHGDDGNTAENVQPFVSHLQIRTIRALGTVWRRELRFCNRNVTFLILVLALPKTMSKLPLPSISNRPLLQGITQERITKLVNPSMNPPSLTCRQRVEIGSTSSPGPSFLPIVGAPWSESTRATLAGPRVPAVRPVRIPQDHPSKISIAVLERLHCKRSGWHHGAKRLLESR